MAKKTWRERLTRAKRRGRFLNEDRRTACSWTTCAVGEHQGEFKPGFHTVPYSDVLRGLGRGFTNAVWDGTVDEAESLYEKIQAWFRRSAKRRKARQEA